MSTPGPVLGPDRQVGDVTQLSKQLVAASWEQMVAQRGADDEVGEVRRLGRRTDITVDVMSAGTRVVSR